jgi:hypothetical protein
LVEGDLEAVFYLRLGGAFQVVRILLVVVPITSPKMVLR